MHIIIKTRGFLVCVPPCTILPYLMLLCFFLNSNMSHLFYCIWITISYICTVLPRHVATKLEPVSLADKRMFKNGYFCPYEKKQCESRHGRTEHYVGQASTHVYFWTCYKDKIRLLVSDGYRAILFTCFEVTPLASWSSCDFLALGQLYDCSNNSKVTLKYVGKHSFNN